MEVDYNEWIKSEPYKEKVRQRLKIDKYCCQMCGSHGSPSNPLECHHFSYRTLGHENVWTELVIVCDCCHTMLSRLMNRIVDENGRRGWTNKEIPRMTTITYNGIEQEHRKENLKSEEQRS